MDYQSETIRAKRVAFLGISLSSISALTVILGFPLLYTYIQSTQSAMHHDLQFCRTRAGSLNGEYSRLSGLLSPRKERSAGQCCSCGAGGQGPVVRLLSNL
ncbi:hypothetical protein WR25_26539 [Diploscapter pachys]|uniref:Nematode cuticle collagen N-terminal domain-containing protein n=1 Tax=Diploscapter pachys TaxID=2018661 RepID=A0A2A2LIK3_9BILA|nr:hypothetical protein WR25_26539 [Diploscapter pachys]